jgi:hypothetical protein
MTLNVLVLETDRGAADPAIAALQDAGHRVVRCHDGTAPAFPCGALTEGGCPLHNEIVDVALTVRRHPRSQPAPQEDGVTCALRTHVPLVVAGAPAMNPFDDFATRVVDGVDDVVSACEAAASAPLPRHSDAATRALRNVLETHDIVGISARVDVRRVHGALHVVVAATAPIARPVRNVAAVRITAALREIDRDARAIDVSFV